MFNLPYSFYLNLVLNNLFRSATRLPNTRTRLKWQKFINLAQLQTVGIGNNFLHWLSLIYLRYINYQNLLFIRYVETAVAVRIRFNCYQNAPKKALLFRSKRRKALLDTDLSQLICLLLSRPLNEFQMDYSSKNDFLFVRLDPTVLLLNLKFLRSFQHYWCRSLNCLIL